MTNFNFLSKSSSQSCGHSSVTLASTVGSPSVHRRGIMLKLISVLVLVLTFGVGNVWGAGTTVTYTLTAKTTVSKSGTAPTGATATVTSTGAWYTTGSDGRKNTDQMTAGKNTVLTLSGFKGYKITGIVLNMCSNSSNGKGTFSAVAGSTTIASISSATNFNAWYDNTSYGTSRRNVNVSLTNSTYEIKQDEDVVITIACVTTNSLYISSWSITYEAAATGCTGTKLGTPSVTAEASSGQVRLTWPAVSNASGYQLKWNGGDWAAATSPVTKTGLTNGTAYTYQVKAIGNGSTYCDGDASTEASATPNVYYTVTWNNNGSEYTTTQVVSGQRPTFPEAPGSCDTGEGASTTFYGWATSTWSGKAASLEDSKLSGITIYTQASDMPTVTGNGVVYNAVFCKGGSGDLFNWEGSDTNDYASLTGLSNVESNSIDGYAAANKPYRVRFNSSSDYIIISLDAAPGALSFDIKKLGGTANSTFTIQESTTKNGTFTDVQSFTPTGSTQNDVFSYTTTTAFKSTTRAIKIAFTLVTGGNTGLGRIRITPAASASNYMTTCCNSLGQINGSISWTSPTEAVVTWDKLDDQVSAWALSWSPNTTGSSITSAIADKGTTQKTATVSDLACGTEYTFTLTPTIKSGVCTVETNPTIVSSYPKPTITLDKVGTTNGDFSISGDMTSQCPGENVTVVLAPNSGYEVDVLTVGGNDVTSSVSNNSYTFEMPSSNVTIHATFKTSVKPEVNVTATDGLTGTTLSYGNVAKETDKALTITVTGSNLTNDVTWALADTDDESAGMFSISPSSTTIGKSDATSGQALEITFTPAAAKTYTATLTFSTTGAAANKVITLTGTGKNLYTVTFKRDGQVYDTKQAFDGETVTFPENPSKFDNDYPNFIGWADAISGIATSAPTLKSASDAITANAEYHAVFANAPQPVNSYEKVTTTGDLANNCKYVIAAWDAAESKYYAATGSLTSNGYNLDKENITSKVSNNIVTAPASSEVWKATVANSKVQFQNVGNSKYMSAVVNDNHTNFTLTENTGEQYTYSVSTGAWTFTTSSLSNNKQIEYYDDSGRDYFSYYTTQDAPIYLFKQQSAYTEWVTRAVVKHTISYDANTTDSYTGSVPDPISVVDGEDYTVSDAVLSERAGYNFIGWNSSNSATTAQTTLTNVTADVTLFAVWEIIPTYNIEFSVNGAKVDDLKIEDILQGTAITFPTAENIAAASAFPTTDKKFMGWIEASSYASDVAPTFVTSATAAADKTYYAVFADVIGDDVVDEYNNDLTFPFALWEKTNERGAKNNSEAWQMYGYSSNTNPEGEINSAAAYNNLVTLSLNAKTGNNSTTLTIYHSADKETWTQLTTKEISKNQTYDDYSIDLSDIPTGAKYIKVKNSTNSFYITSITLTQGAVSDYVTNISPLSSIAITTAPSKTVYKKGEMLNLTSMVVTATYENERTRAVTNYTVTPNTTTALATTDVSFTVSYTEGEITKTATQNISVLALDNIAVTTIPTKTTYQEGESFDKAGMVIKATWGTGANKIEENLEANAYTVTPSLLNSTDITSVTISYTDDANDTKTTTQAVTVSERPNLVMTWNVAGETTTSKIYINGDEQYLLALPEEDPEVPEAFGAGYEFIGWTSDATIARDGQNINWAAANDEMTVATEFKAVFAQANAPFFKETFDDCDGTGGNDDNWSGTIASNNVNTDNNGWTFENEGGAKACVKFGTGNKKGSAETPSFSLTGSATLTFKAAAWNNNNEGTTLNISADGATLKQNNAAIASVTLTKGAWTTYTVDVTDATGTVTIKFEAANTSNNRFFLDEVLVKRGDEEYKDYRFVPSSVTTPVIGLAEATYYGAQNATITQAQEKQIFYSLDGNTWTEYTEPVALNQAGSVTLYAKAYDESEDDYSSVVSKSYTIVTEIADPEITPSKAFYGGSMEVEITHPLSSEEGFALQYSYDGESYEVYTGALTITEDKTVYAKATIGTLEATASATYTVGRFITYWRVTDASQLRAGQRAIIAQHVSADGDVQVMDAQSGNNCAAKASTATNGGAIITPAFDAYAITLEAVEGGKFAFKVPDGYLYAASSSSNHLKVQTTNNANGQWTIVINNDKSATITAQGTATHNLLKYNSGSNLFSCYESGQTAVAIYVDEICTDINVSALEDNADVTVGNGATLTIDADDKPLNDITVKDGGMVAIENAQEANHLTVEAGGEVIINAPLQAEGVHLDVNSTMEVNSTVNVPSFSISVKLGSTGEATNVTVSGSGNIAAPEGYVDMELSNDANPDQWHAFTVPFEVDALNGIYDAETGAKLANEVNYAIMDYHGDIRAQGKYGWKKYRSILQPGVFYLITVDGASKVLRFMKKAGSSYVAPNSMAMTYYGDNDPENTNNGWCGVGNQNMFGGYVPFRAQILNSTGTGYVSYVANETKFSACIPFFIQIESDDNLAVSATLPSSVAARRVAAKGINDIKVTFGNENYSDKLYISANEDAKNAYEVGKDLVKMTMSNTPVIPQIFGKAYGNKLCMVYAPMSNDQAVYDLSLYAPANGEYTIAAPNMENADLYLTKDGAIIWNLTMSAYPISLNKGTTEGYGLLLKAKAPQTPTGVEQSEVSHQPSDIQKIIIDDNVFILRGGQMYDVTGKAVK